MTIQESPWLTVDEAANRARCSHQTVRAALSTTELIGYQRDGKRKGHWRIHLEDVDRWVRGEIRPVAAPVATRRGTT